MSLTPLVHAGLPVVPQATAGELLGSWLLRVAQVYGLQLHDLLVRLDAVPSASRVSPPWYALHQDHLRLTPLAVALHRSVESIVAMAPPQCDRRWPVELGFCRQCLEESASTGVPHRWLRHWMHPLALACEKHRAWLAPVTTRRLREFSKMHDLAALPRRTSVQWPRPALQEQWEFLLIDSALWLEQLFASPAVHRPPWGSTQPDRLAQIVSSLIQVLMSPAAAEWVRHQMGRPRDLPKRRQHWACRTFRIDDRVIGAVTLETPDPLSHRQFVLGLLGHYLRLPPAHRAPSLTKLFVNGISPWRRARWPAAAVDWVLPRSAMNPPSKPRRRTSTRRARPRPAPLFGG